MFAIVPGVLSAATCAAIRERLAHADFQPGTMTAAGPLAVKNNVQAHDDEAAALVVTALNHSRPFQLVTFMRATTRIRFVKYGVGMCYGDHLDAALMSPDLAVCTPASVRADLAVTLGLCGPNEYDGGELVSGTEQVKPPLGGTVVYPADSIHRVEPVTAGERLVAVFWVESRVRSIEQREILHAIERASNTGTIELRQAYNRLVRMWA